VEFAQKLMPTQLLNGTSVANRLHDEIKREIENCIAQKQRRPGLAVVLVGDDAASQIYVTRKREACKRVGIYSEAFYLPANTTEEQLLTLITKLNVDKNIDGILVQLPLPRHINTDTVIEKISYEKDVDGFHPYNLGRLAQRRPLFRPCTPCGIIYLLKHYQINLTGLHAVIVGASNIVGRPLAFELLNAHCTVTICHSKTTNLAEAIKQADLFISAIGKRNIIQSDWIKPGAIIVDVGIHRENDKLVGDLDFAALQNEASWITPVPGGVGPMTVAMLMNNTYQAYRSFMSK
jgi:methylenetetrahydrofolate dehydrogenase (NADP+) / methenyltetrahydrofolate cyclohydrolase